MVATTFSVFVGSETGLFKGIDVSKNSFQNLNDTSGLDRSHEITAICWKDSSENQIYIGHKNQKVKIYDCSSLSFVKQLDLLVGEGPIVGIASYDSGILTAVESGAVRLWNEDKQNEKVIINAGINLNRMRQNASKPERIATGGEENELKIWDVKALDGPIFTAKNVRNDFLDLRVPVWVTDMQFLPNSDKIVTCSRHHHIRLYDPKAQRRPVVNMEFEKHPLMSLSLAHREHQLIVGSSRGRMALVDLRKKALVHVFKGFAGSIRYVQCHPTLPYVASCGLDRFLRIHDLNSRKLLNKVYLKSRLNCLVIRSDFGCLLTNENKTDTEIKSKVDSKSTLKHDPENEEEEELWKNMKVIKEKLQQRKRAAQDHTDVLTKVTKRTKLKTKGKMKVM